MATICKLCRELQSLQRQRVWHKKSAQMMTNRLQATIAGTLGYCSTLGETDRKALFSKAATLIKLVVAGEKASPHRGIILTCQSSIDPYLEMKRALEKRMLKLVKQLPVASWVEEPEQRGFGLPMLAIVVGEAGDLNNYANPAKLWRRFGCAPWEKDGIRRMGEAWRKQLKPYKGLKLHAAEWEEFGYSPRRRSIAHNIGDALLKGNTGPYRDRYDEVKQGAREKHPEWFACEKCNSTGKVKGKKCPNCKGKSELTMHAHKHAMLLMTKLLLKNLWIEWTEQ